MSFTLEWRDTATSTSQTVDDIFSVEDITAGVATFISEMGSLSSGTQYEFRVRESDGTNVSAWTAWTQFTTSGGGATGPATPVNLGTTNLQATSARLTWEQG